MSGSSLALRRDWPARLRDANLKLPAWTGAAIPAAIAAVLGLIGIGDKSLWLDEAFSVMVARLPTADLVTYLVREEMHAAPYYLLLHAWTFFGSGEAAVRSLSVIAGVIAVVATYAVGRRYGVGAGAALLLATAPMFVQFEQEARVYTLLVAWSALSTLAFLRFAEHTTRTRAVVYFLTAAAMLYMHPIGGFVIVAHALAALLLMPAENRRKTLVVVAAAALAWLPMLVFMVRNRDKINWIEPLSVNTATEHLLALGGGGVVAGAVLVLLALGMRRDLPALWLFVPVVGILVLSVVVQPSLQSRYLIGTLPAIAIVAARSKPVIVALLIALSMATNYGWYTAGVKDDWRGGVAWVTEQAQAGDGIVFTPAFARPAFEYYGEIGEPLYPATPWDEQYLPGIRMAMPLAPDIDNPRIWLIASHGEGTPAEVAQVLSYYMVADRAEFGPNGPRISLLVRVPQATSGSPVPAIDIRHTAAAGVAAR